MNIKADKKARKWDTDMHRREQVAKAIDFYNNQQEPYTDDYLRETYSEKAYKKLVKYMTCDSLTQNIIDDMSIMFQGGISIVTDNDTVNEFISEVMEYTQFQSLLIKIDRLVNLTKKLAIVPFYDVRTKRFSFDIITGDKAFVEQRPDMPTEAEAVFYSTGVLIDTPTVSDVVNLYTMYNLEEKAVVELNAEGDIIDVIKREPNPYLPYNEIPFVWFYDDLTIDTFWPECGNRIVKDNLEINRLLINHNLMLDYQTFSTLVTIGLDQGAPLYIGPQFHLNLVKKSYSANDPTPDAKYITPQAAIKEVWDIICAKAVRCAKSVGLSAQAYTTQSTDSGYSSGYQLKLSKIDIINKNIMRQQFFVFAIKRLIKMLLLCSNIYTKTSFPLDINIKVNIYDPSVDLSPMEIEQVRAQKIANGTWSAIRSLMEDNPDLTIDEAKKLYKEIQDENRLALSSNPMFQTAGGANTGINNEENISEE